MNVESERLESLPLCLHLRKAFPSHPVCVFSCLVPKWQFGRGCLCEVMTTILTV